MSSDLPAARDELIARWNATHVEVPTGKCIPDLLEDQARRSPDVTAVIFRGQGLTYRELDERAGRLAHRLQRMGAGPEKIVAICADRSLEMMVSLLGILKSGAAYLPMDPSYPSERLQFVLEDSKAVLLLVPRRMQAQFAAATAETVLVDLVCKHGEDVPPESPGYAQSRNLAYVNYTSGSTGKPKGVMVEHRNVVNFFAGMDLILGEEPGVWLAVTSISFDISVLELFWPLARGGTVVIQSDADRLTSGEYGIAAQIRSYDITHMQCTPSLARLLALNRECLESMGSLKKLILGGEALSAALVNQLRPAVRAEILNLYGPTETTVWSAAYPVRGDEAAIPIGRPIANTSLYVLDEQLRNVPIGDPGELFIGGRGVARGYLGKPELTRERFLGNPFRSDSSERIYRTGDLARYRSDGNVEFLGRVDNQVKIRGFRIEPEEIENVLGQHPCISAAAVVAMDSSSGEKELIGYAVPKVPDSVTVAELRIYLQRRLPTHMVPAGLFILDALPTTPNGKTDRKTLAERSRSAGGESALTTSPDGIERLIARICGEILKTARVPIDRNFLDLGLMSLQIAELAARLCEALDREILLTDLFEHPTIRSLAAHLSTRGRVREAPPAAAKASG
jgi:amino acid adenylation domain-containing protein